MVVPDPPISAKPLEVNVLVMSTVPLPCSVPAPPPEPLLVPVRMRFVMLAAPSALSVPPLISSVAVELASVRPPTVTVDVILTM